LAGGSAIFDDGFTVASEPTQDTPEPAFDNQPTTVTVVETAKPQPLPQTLPQPLPVPPPDEPVAQLLPLQEQDESTEAGLPAVNVNISDPDPSE